MCRFCEQARASAAGEIWQESNNEFSNDDKLQVEKCTNLRRLPCIILTGFLGAGKTTLLNRILSNTASKVAVIENEIGETSIDDQLIDSRQNLNQADEVILMPNGCMCCRVRGDLVDALKRLIGRRNDIDAVIIELSGLSSLAPVVQTLFSNPYVHSRLKLVRAICTVDASSAGKLLLGDTTNSESSLIREQISLADLVLVNKIDLLQSEDILSDIHKEIHELNPLCNISNICCLSREPGVILPDLQDPKLWQADGFALRVGHFGDIEKVENHSTIHKNMGFASVSVVVKQGPLDYKRLQSWLEESILQRYPDALVRYKGILWIRNHSVDTKMVLQGVFGHAAFESGGLWRTTESPKTTIVFIGRIDNPEFGRLRDRLIQGVRNCVVESEVAEEQAKVSQFAFMKAAAVGYGDRYDA